MIDLGRWLDEAHSIPCSSADEAPEEHDDASRGDAGYSDTGHGDTGRGETRPPVRLPPGWHDA